MRFSCVCLAPAIDATVRLNAWPTDGCTIKNAVETFSPGGKAINVARWLAIRGASVVCTGLLGEDNAAMFEKELAGYGIEDRFIRVSGATRVNEMFVTPEGSFKVNRTAFPDLCDDEALVAAVFERLGPRTGDVVILSGSLPKTWPADTYRVLIEKAKSAGAKVVLDASGAALCEGVKAHPHVIKPNADECAPLVGFAPKTPEEFCRATELLRRTCDLPIVSDGGAGCWFGGMFVAAPRVEVLDTTAAGDTLLAEWCWRTWGAADVSPEKWAVAAGSAACTMPGGVPPSVAFVETLVREVLPVSEQQKNMI